MRGSTIGLFGRVVKTLMNTVSNAVPPKKQRTISVTDANLCFSPYNWRLGDEDSVQTTSPGAYLKAKFSGTSLTLKLDTTSFSEAGVLETLYPTLAYSIDNQAFTSVRLTAGMASLVLAQDLPDAAHTLFLYYRYNMDTVDLWDGPINAVRLTGIMIDAEASLLPPDVRPTRLLVYGDSMAQAAYDDYAKYTDIDSRFTFAFVLAAALNAELGVIGNARQGWGAEGQGNCPPFHTPEDALGTSWDKHDSRHSRLIAGQLCPPPDYLLVVMGRNDGSVAPARVKSFLCDVRATAPGTRISLVIPFAGTNRAGITSGYDAYQATTPDDKTELVDLHTDDWFTSAGPATAYSGDKIHPNIHTHGLLGAMLAATAFRPKG